MTLAVDIGNTNIVVALHWEGHWSNLYRFETKEPQPEYYYSSALRQILLESSVTTPQVRRVIVSSVVPELTSLICGAVRQAMDIAPIVLGPDIFLQLDIPVPHPYEIGSDLVANAYGALKTVAQHCLVVDFGTALTFTAVSFDEGISGVTIAPGIKTAFHSLSLRTAQLPSVPVEFPPSALGKDTITAIQSGVMWGYIGLVKELVYRIKQEVGEQYVTVATGGLSSLMDKEEALFEHRNPHLTLDGMRCIADFLELKRG
ncbi:MAG: type III pantothenate kinase [Saprospiraceae bacterium]|nr:type III pantothenate kinase [Saprospiraceae bacterium]